jgi:polyphenol oxidase
MPRPDDWLVPDWPAPAGVNALFTARSGGVSVAPFDRLNLGQYVRDDPAAVATNRERLAEALGVRPVFLKQVHGAAVATLHPDTADGSEADACVSTCPGLACTILVADCLPVLFTNVTGTAVAAAHAGWRGLAGHGADPAGQGVLEATFQAFVRAVQGLDPAASRDSVAASTLVWLGPCIGPEAFEVGAEVRAAFVSRQADAASCFAPTPEPGKFRADLQALARLRLRALGITQVFGNDGATNWCTVSQPSRFFSHRRDAARLGSTGRMAACVWMG